jgi:hypothetical protein
VRVECRDDARDRVEVSVDELTEPTVVVDRPRAAAAGDEELEIRQAERVLDVDREEADPEAVLGRGRYGMLVRPALCVGGEPLVPHAPELADALGLEVRWDREHRREV